jgi:CHAD domain-containing protein
LLSPAKLEQFRDLSATPLQSSRDAVTRMLESARWRAHLEEWRRYLARARRHDKQRDAERSGPAQAGALDAALVRARLALAVALPQDDDTNWHKFRIAVKEVRYTAEREPPAPFGESRVADVVETCKGLQSLLGGWHDCVIQLQLLDELAPSPLVADLRQSIAERRHQRLAEIREAVASQPLLRPCIGRAGTSRRRSSDAG